MTADNLSGEAVPEALVLALGEVFRPLGLRFKFSIQNLPEAPHKRLWVRCESTQNIDYQILAEPLNLKLRALQLPDFRDAIVRCVAPGASSSEWRLRIDLTPAPAILAGWARWGDIQAIAMSLNLALTPVDLQVTGVLKNWRLHLFCCSQQDSQQGSPKFPNKAKAIELIGPLLHSLQPQGIQGATIYGVQAKTNGLPSEDASPLWVHWLDLPAASDANTAIPPLALAEQGDMAALTFIIQRLLNPDLEWCCTHGVLTLELLMKGDILHVMSEAPICPEQKEIVDPTLKVLRQLALPGLMGVKIYGRVAGQQQPVWHYSSEFRRATTRLYTKSESTQLRIPQPTATHWRERLLASDWLRSSTASAAAAPLVWQSVTPWAAAGLLLVGGLEFTSRSLASQTKAASGQVLRLDRPSFNNAQLDEKLAAYRQFCAQGSPDVLIVGSSRALRGIDPQVIQQELVSRGLPAGRIYNLGINGATAQLVDLILRRSIEPTQLPRLVIWADGARAFNDGRPDRTFAAITASTGYRQLPSSEGSAITTTQPLVMDSYETLDLFLNRVLAKGFSSYRSRDLTKARLQEITPGGRGSVSSSSSSSALPAASEQVDERGFLPISLTFDPNTYYQKYAKVSGDSDGDYANFTLTGSQDNATRRTIDFLQQRRIPVVFVNIPLSDRYLDKVRQQHELTFKQYMQSLAQTGHLQFVDLVGTWAQDYSLYSDPSHINKFGAVQVSTHLVRNTAINWSAAVSAAGAQ
jgi:hypothetical protein